MKLRLLFAMSAMTFGVSFTALTFTSMMAFSGWLFRKQYYNPLPTWWPTVHHLLPVIEGFATLSLVSFVAVLLFDHWLQCRD